MPKVLEPTVNAALAEVLQGLRPKSWTVRAEETGAVEGSAERPDILVEDAAGWPVALEAEWPPAAGVEREARDRLGIRLSESGLPIETAVALIYPLELDEKSGETLRDAIRATEDLQYALFTHRVNQAPERLPASGWLRGNVRDLAMLLHRAAAPAGRVDALAEELERGVEQAADLFTKSNPHGGPGGERIAKVLGQPDDRDGQTRRMAMTIIANALIFQEAMARADFLVHPIESSGDAADVRPVKIINDMQDENGFVPSRVLSEWAGVLHENYYPIFWSARELLTAMPTNTAAGVLASLWRSIERLVAAGVTHSHDLTGVVFQRLIADRKFLATFYTRPAAAALLAGLALPSSRAPGNADWGDADTLAAMQIGDFACGTGTLLSAAYQRISLLHEMHGGDSEALHAPMMEHGLFGVDVLKSAVHLTATHLAARHPAAPFKGESILTARYGRHNGSVHYGSLNLLSAQIDQNLFSDLEEAETAGGNLPESVQQLSQRITHGTFDLIIMNPPFVRWVGQEGVKIGQGNPAAAALDVPRDVQEEMTARLRQLRGGPPLASGNAGIAADFLDLAFRKIRAGETIALVLPLSALSGSSWERTRRSLIRRTASLIAITIAGAKSDESAFSADTGMADCLLVFRVLREGDEPPAQPRGTFISLHSAPKSQSEGTLLASEIARMIDAGAIARVEGATGGTLIHLGGDLVATAADAPLPAEGPWPFVGLSDSSLGAVAHNLCSGRLPGWRPRRETRAARLPIVPISEIAERGTYHMDIYWDNADGSPRGPLQLHDFRRGHVPELPILWGHNAKLERCMILRPDKYGDRKVTPGYEDEIQEKAVDVWDRATRLHYNRDVRFNSQSLIAAMTEERCIGGHSWPSIVFKNPEQEYAFALWANSSLGLLIHWWLANKTQSGRGRTSITAIPEIPTLDLRKLSNAQHEAAKRVFEELSSERFLPFDQIDEDPARELLDRRLLVEVLGLPEELCWPGESIELLRKKLAAEPQIHGGKKTRIVFEDLDDPDPKTGLMWRERTEKRDDR